MSYRVQCASNMRQLGTAFSLYSQDWDGFWPGPGGLVGDRNYWSQTDPRGGLNPYIKQQGTRSIWCCPFLTEWHGKFLPRSYSMNSYLRTPSDIEYPTCVEYPWCLGCQCGVNLNKLQDTSRTVLLFEGIPLTNGSEDKLDYLYRCANWSRVRGYTNNIVNTLGPGEPWHGRVNNYLYADYHIASRPPGKKTTGVLTDYDEMYQWYVDKAAFRRKFAAYR